MNQRQTKSADTLHPLVVRITHWINAFAMIVMIGSGWRIYNASPLFNFRFANEFTIGGWLGGALQWHFAAMWLLVINGLVYLAYGFWSGHFKASLWPISLRALIADVRAALSLKLGHASGGYNAVQKVLYLGVLAVGVIVVLSGLAVWKPVQFHLLASFFGGYEGARLVHFFCMSVIVAFVVIHLVLVAIVPSVLWPMITGRAPRLKKEVMR
jgi:thiosulfate reductase cytochrome b subunit